MKRLDRDRNNDELAQLLQKHEEAHRLLLPATKGHVTSGWAELPGFVLAIMDLDACRQWRTDQPILSLVHSVHSVPRSTHMGRHVSDHF